MRARLTSVISEPVFMRAIIALFAGLVFELSAWFLNLTPAPFSKKLRSTRISIAFTSSMIAPGSLAITARSCTRRIAA